MLTQCGKLLVLLGLIYLSVAREVPEVASNPVGISPTSQIFIGDTLYFIENKIKRNWFEARKYCEGIGYNLISFETTEKFKAINSYLDSQNDKNIYWTSGNDFLTLGRHVWFPSGKPVATELWYPREPNNYEGIEHCDEVGSRSSHLLNDRDCTIKRNYICERTLL